MDSKTPHFTTASELIKNIADFGVSILTSPEIDLKEDRSIGLGLEILLNLAFGIIAPTNNELVSEFIFNGASEYHRFITSKEFEEVTDSTDSAFRPLVESLNLKDFELRVSLLSAFTFLLSLAKRKGEGDVGGDSDEIINKFKEILNNQNGGSNESKN